LIIDNTHDVIIRYLRVRPGDAARVEQDALWVHASRDVIIDHCSTSWGTDETLSVTGGGASHVTVQWSMITESLNNSVHRKGPHGYGSLLRLDGSVSLHHNLFAHNNSRNPRAGCYGDMERGSLVDFRNNVVYNWGERPGYTADDKASVNLVANYYKPGPSTLTNARPYAFVVGGESTSLYLDQNIHEGNEIDPKDDWALVRLLKKSWAELVRLNTTLPVATVRTEHARDALQSVMGNAGATRPVRDTVDKRVIQQVKSGEGRIIDSQSEVGGWPLYESGPVSPDTDIDAMPDAWEMQHGLDPLNAADGNIDHDGDGYTNVEEFLNSTDPHRKEGS
jgi:hypothetical protein